MIPVKSGTYALASTDTVKIGRSTNIIDRVCGGQSGHYRSQRICPHYQITRADEQELRARVAERAAQMRKARAR